MMPFPKVIAKLNKYTTNRLFLPFAGWIPPFSILTHRGRRSGKEYRVPILAFKDGDEFVFVLTYGRKVDWARNLIKYDSGILNFGGKKYDLNSIRIIPYEEKRCKFPVTVRFFLGLIEVEDCLVAKYD